MGWFFLSLPRNVIACFKGGKIVWHVVAVILTIILVRSGFDWLYFYSTRDFRPWAFPAAVIGQLVPMTVPLLLVAVGGLGRKATAARTGWALGQAALIGWFISSAYKSVTGRPHPPRAWGPDTSYVAQPGPDTSHVFHFGFLHGGIFWGWPSSHTAVAFAMAVTLFTLFPQRRWLGMMAIVYAFYIGLGVSMTIHWFSDFAAGAMVGTAIGLTVGKSFLSKS